MPTDLSFESHFWGSCCNTSEEEDKHRLYARLMGLPWEGSGTQLDGYGWNVEDRSVVDIGGGPTSMLLRTIGLKAGSMVVDPLKFPDWVTARYQCRNLTLKRSSGEAFTETGFDEAWIYNVLQHSEEPDRVIANARRSASRLRIFEWIDIPAYPGHPHMLTAANLQKWVGSEGYVTELKGENGCWGKCWSGVFPTGIVEPEEQERWPDPTVMVTGPKGKKWIEGPMG